MPSSPRTPRHSRHPSSIDFTNSYNSATSSPQQERRQSRSSIQEAPSTPLLNHRHSGLDINIFSSGGVAPAGGNGLGNLADELADAFSDGEDYDDPYYDQGGEAAPDISVDLDQSGVPGAAGTRDSGVEVESPGGQPRQREKSMSLSLPSPNGRRGKAGSEYDGSEYGSESDLDSPGMPPSLVAKIDAVESLARRGTESNGSAADGAFKRVTEGLRDLGSQAGVEGGASRLITAHSALTTHLNHQMRLLQNLTSSILSPLVPPPDPETIDDLLPILVSLSETMPRPSTNALNSLTALHTISADLALSLNYLSDTLHMSRQTTTTATRRLKSAKELVADMKREEELREEGERWLTRGNWGERLRNRECAHVCGEVVGGFEEVCNSWRARLLASAESAQA
ncbi:hypothetical protein CONLIGDRAFT_575857 [Coniochaeta ligniaria NRRL 30616]|uniref:Uncharacterized protein n=1 Tax=Coniochaeta ligniaria NRRL 30616 TaxID=1408157 RepID=A0A1J7IQS3_9PEZI|nr:hypothetical protein CONLIGDRAFT_575857 [Coniochaeta ligniaria NRRL 30616]